MGRRASHDDIKKKSNLLTYELEIYENQTQMNFVISLLNISLLEIN